MAQVHFTDLVEMQQRSCQKFGSGKLFGSKIDGSWQYMTFSEFATQVDHARAGLASLGVVDNDAVMVISNNRVEWAIGCYATFSVGGWYVPTYEVTLPKEWRFILEDSNAKVCFAATKEIYEKVRGFLGELPNLKRVICFELDPSHEDSFAKLLADGAKNPVPAASPGKDHIAGLIYTSGTTGVPKGVKLSHGNIVSNIEAVHQVFPMGEADSSLSFLPWAHSFGQTVELHCMLSMGARIDIAESVNKLIDNLAESKPTILFSVPRVFNRIYDALQKRMEEETPVKKFMFQKGVDVARRRRALEEQGKSSGWLDFQYGIFDKLVFSKVRARFGGRLKYAFSGGAALSKEVAEFIDDMNITVYEGYGLTETSPIATANFPNNRKIGSIGKEIPGVTVYICDEDQNVLGPEQDGEIVVVGPNVMVGYHNREEATAEVITTINGQRAFRTGDMGRRGTDGFIYITGRFKEQYKLENGKYVSPSPLEEQMKLSGFISQAMLYGDNRTHNIAVIVPDLETAEKWAKQNGVADTSPQALVKNADLIKKIQEEIVAFGKDFKSYERPQRVLLVTEEFTPENDMLTPSLKLKRRNVIKNYEKEIEALYK